MMALGERSAENAQNYSDSAHSQVHFCVGNVVIVVSVSHVIKGYFYLQQRKKAVPLQRLLQK